MQHIAPGSLVPLATRMSYLLSFLSFTPTTGATIHASAPLIAPLIPSILTAVYTTLLHYDITAKAFFPNPDHTSAPDLRLNHQTIQRQKEFLRNYLLRIAGTQEWSPDAPIWEYLDKVAVAHTGQAGFAHRKGKPGLRVEYVHLGLLLAFVEDLVIEAVMGMEDVRLETRVEVVKAWNKVLWIQNDLFARQYVVDWDTGCRPKDAETKMVDASRRSYWNLAATGAVGVLVGVAVAKNYLM